MYIRAQLELIRIVTKRRITYVTSHQSSCVPTDQDDWLVGEMVVDLGRESGISQRGKHQSDSGPEKLKHNRSESNQDFTS